jgi:KEOPS complex subunit Cgi121
MTKNQIPQVIIVSGIGTIDDLEPFIQKVQRFSEKHDVFIQLFNADMIFGKNHLLSAAMHAIRSKDENRMTTNSLEMELFLYASGERQLKIAIPKIGVKKGANKIAFVIMPRFYQSRLKDNIINTFFSEMNIERDDSLLQGTDSTLERFGFTKEELSTVPSGNYEKLILEKIALIDIIK